MRLLRKYLVPVLIGLGTFAALQFFNPLSPPPETARLDCVFEAHSETGALPIPYRQAAVSRIKFQAELSGKSTHDDVLLWHAKGTVNFADQSQQLAGAVFLKTDNEVRGLGLYRDQYPHSAEDLRISTLNENGILDWNEQFAFIYFENASEKLAHAFDY